MGSWPSGAKPRTPVMRQSKTERKRKKKYGHLTKSRPQRVNSLLRTLWWSRIQIRWICTGWIPSDSELCMWFQKPWVTESLYIKHRSARGVYRATAPALVDLLTSGAFERVARQWARSAIVRARASDNVPTTCRVLLHQTRKPSERLWESLLHLQNSERRCQNCALRYNFLKAARSVLKQWFVYDCTYLLLCSWDVQCYMLLYATERQSLVLWINNFKISLKTSVNLVLATEHLKL